MNVPYQQILTHCNAPIDAFSHRLEMCLHDLRSGTHPGAMAIINAWSAREHLPMIKTLAAEITDRFSRLVIVGAGGSGLSGRVLSCLKPGSKTVLHFLDNVDPDAIEDMLASAPLERSLFLFISKSGETAETLAHFYIIDAALQQALGENARAHALVITLETPNPLRTTAENRGIRCLAHPADIGGRFSVFTLVGLLPAAVAGLDIAAFLTGAQQLSNALLSTPGALQFPPAAGAALQYHYAMHGRCISVMLPYAQRLEGFSSWYRQSWAESLGKNGKGTTPIRAIGSTDQHSQLQLYLDGPKDKFFTMILLKREGTGQRIPLLDNPLLTYLSGKTSGDVLAAEQQATLATLAGAGAPVRVMTLARLNEETLGALLAHFTLEIIFSAALYEVNPFDQPAVEEGKQLARDYLLTHQP